MSINLPELTADVNAHQNLPDQPTLSANELKQAWDQPSSDIKTYLNNTLIPQIESQVTSEITNGVNAAKAYTDSAVGGIDLDADNIDYDNTSSGMTATKVQGAIDELKSGLSSATSTADEKIKYSDFAFTTLTESATLSPAGSKTGTATVTKSGYYPLAVSGTYNAGDPAIAINRCNITSRANGTVTVTYKMDNSDYGNNRNGKLTCEILWVKIS